MKIKIYTESITNLIRVKWIFRKQRKAVYEKVFGNKS